jgi:hypothetical protein
MTRMLFLALPFREAELIPLCLLSQFSSFLRDLCFDVRSNSHSDGSSKFSASCAKRIIGELSEA